jgi:hypothetical protein
MVRIEDAARRVPSIAIPNDVEKPRGRNVPRQSRWLNGPHLSARLTPIVVRALRLGRNLRGETVVLQATRTARDLVGHAVLDVDSHVMAMSMVSWSGGRCASRLRRGASRSGRDAARPDQASPRFQRWRPRRSSGAPDTRRTTTVSARPPGRSGRRRADGTSSEVDTPSWTFADSR